MNKGKILEAVARGWCTQRNSNKVMDADLAMDITEEVYLASLKDREAYLGCATTESLINEIKARIGEAGLQYRTVDS